MATTTTCLAAAAQSILRRSRELLGAVDGMPLLDIVPQQDRREAMTLLARLQDLLDHGALIEQGSAA